MNTKLKMSAALAALLALGACNTFKGPKKTPTMGDRVAILVSENGAEVDKTIADVQVLLPPPYNTVLPWRLVRALRSNIVNRHATMRGGWVGHFSAAAPGGGARHSARAMAKIGSTKCQRF